MRKGSAGVLCKEFLGTPEYYQHKKKRFPAVDLQVPVAEQEAFLLSDPEVRRVFEGAYHSTAALYYQGQPAFEEIMTGLAGYLQKM